MYRPAEQAEWVEEKSQPESTFLFPVACFLPFCSPLFNKRGFGESSRRLLFVCFFLFLHQSTGDVVTLPGVRRVAPTALSYDSHSHQSHSPSTACTCPLDRTNTCWVMRGIGRVALSLDCSLLDTRGPVHDIRVLGGRVPSAGPVP